MKRLLYLFDKIQDAKVSKLFLIDAVTNPNNTVEAKKVMIFLNSATPSTYSFQRSTEIFYIVDDQGYRFSKGTSYPIALNSRLTNKYLQFFDTKTRKLKEKSRKFI